MVPYQLMVTLTTSPLPGRDNLFRVSYLFWGRGIYIEIRLMFNPQPGGVLL